jgi:precorrin-3B C17-methyltransferase
VSGGDPGVFAMAAAVCEEIESGPQSWRTLDVTIVPGITAMLAVAARIGAPLGHDFCALSLSDNLKSWELIERRLDAAASAGFVIALYNPVSRARPWQLGAAIVRLRRHLPPSTPVVFGRAVTRPSEQISIVTLDEAETVEADMATLVIVGSRETRVIARPGKLALVYTPRSAAEVSA